MTGGSGLGTWIKGSVALVLASESASLLKYRYRFKKNFKYWYRFQKMTSVGLNVMFVERKQSNRKYLRADAVKTKTG